MFRHFAKFLLQASSLMTPIAHRRSQNVQNRAHARAQMKASEAGLKFESAGIPRGGKVRTATHSIRRQERQHPQMQVPALAFSGLRARQLSWPHSLLHNRSGACRLRVWCDLTQAPSLVSRVRLSVMRCWRLRSDSRRRPVHRYNMISQRYSVEMKPPKYDFFTSHQVV